MANIPLDDLMKSYAVTRGFTLRRKWHNKQCEAAIGMIGWSYRKSQTTLYMLGAAYPIGTDIADITDYNWNLSYGIGGHFVFESKSQNPIVRGFAASPNRILERIETPKFLSTYELGVQFKRVIEPDIDWFLDLLATRETLHHALMLGDRRSQMFKSGRSQGLLAYPAAWPAFNFKDPFDTP